MAERESPDSLILQRVQKGKKLASLLSHSGGIDSEEREMGVGVSPREASGGSVISERVE